MVRLVLKIPRRATSLVSKTWTLRYGCGEGRIRYKEEFTIRTRRTKRTVEKKNTSKDQQQQQQQQQQHHHHRQQQQQQQQQRRRRRPVNKTSRAPECSCMGFCAPARFSTTAFREIHRNPRGYHPWCNSSPSLPHSIPSVFLPCNPHGEFP